MRGRFLSSARLCAIVAAFIVVISFVAIAPAKAAIVEPVFAPANFTPGAAIDNAYFPLVPGTRFRYAGTVTDPESGDTANEVEDDVVTDQTIDIAGVRARVVKNTVTDDGELVEDTKDYYAQDKSGNVWYLGEDSTALERDDNGNVISTDTSGSWRTGVHGAKPGFIMPANPTVGFAYAQENAPQDQAVDQAQVASLSESVTVPLGSFSNVLKTLETSPLEPGTLEAKLYAKGVGEVQSLEDIDANGNALSRLDLQSITTSSTSIPLPPAAWTGLIVLGVLAGASSPSPWSSSSWCATQRA